MQDVRTIYIYQINIFVCCEWNTLHVDDEVYERIVVEIYWIRVICLWKPSGQIATPVQTKYNWIKYLILPFPTYNKHFTNLLHTSGYIQRWNSTPAASSRSYNLWRTTEKCIIHSSKQARQFQSQILSFVADEIRVCKAENYGPHFDRSHFIFLFVFVRLYSFVFSLIPHLCADMSSLSAPYSVALLSGLLSSQLPLHLGHTDDREAKKKTT